MGKININAVLSNYYAYLAVPASLGILFYENVMTEESNIGWRDYF